MNSDFGYSRQTVVRAKHTVDMGFFRSCTLRTMSLPTVEDKRAILLRKAAINHHRHNYSKTRSLDILAPHCRSFFNNF